MTLIIIFLLGLVIGSFLNVVIDRLPHGQSIISGRSFCDHCKKKILPIDLIPIVSFILLKGKCSFCRKRISLQYPLVEIITGILFVFTYIFLNYNFSRLSGIHDAVDALSSKTSSGQFSIIYHLIIISSLIAIFFTDLKYRIIPDQILVFLCFTASIYLIIYAKNDIFSHISAGIILFLIFLSLVLITRGKGMGLGDVKFAFVMGFILGIPKIIVAFYLSFLTGAAFSLILIMMGKKSMKSTIPFGPFLAGSTVASLYFGDALWNMFRKVMGF